MIHQPMRGDKVEAWIKAARDEQAPFASFDPEARVSWYTLDGLLDAYRLHADTGTPLGEPVEEGKC